MTATTSDFKAIKNTDMRNFAWQLCNLNIDVKALLTDGYNFPEDEMGGCGFELVFGPADASLVGSIDEPSALAPATLIAMAQIMDAMTKAGFECTLNINPCAAGFSLVAIG